jgi:hypothetical protein
LKYFRPILFVLMSLFAGSLFFLLHKNWIIVQWASFGGERISEEKKRSISLKQPVTLFFLQDGDERSCVIHQVWHNDVSENVRYALNNWLSLAFEEHMINVLSKLESVAFAEGEQIVYLSFDRSFFYTDSSIYSKHSLLSVLLKTIKALGLKITKVFFLVRHQVISDAHIDFSRPMIVDDFVGEE